MTKLQKINKVLDILKKDISENGINDAYGAGEFLEESLVELIPYLSVDGIDFFMRNLENFKSNMIKG